MFANGTDSKKAHFEKVLLFRGQVEPLNLLYILHAHCHVYGTCTL